MEAMLLALAAMAMQGSMRLVWRDEFNRNGLPDPKRWTYEKGYVRNQEEQFYTEGRRENARVESGRLIIEARRDGFEGHPVSSASLITKGKASWTYGRIEVRAKLPKGRGTWPAIWTLGDDIDTVGWPGCGEIDIMENVGFDPDMAHFTIHSTGLDGNGHEASSGRVEVPSLSDAFHVYTLDWTPERIEWRLDGRIVHVYAKAEPKGVKWVYDKPQYLMLNLAMGGAWGGQKGVDPAVYPAKFEVDYVRVYQRPK